MSKFDLCLARYFTEDPDDDDGEDDEDRPLISQTTSQYIWNASANLLKKLTVADEQLLATAEQRKALLESVISPELCRLCVSLVEKNIADPTDKQPLVTIGEISKMVDKDVSSDTEYQFLGGVLHCLLQELGDVLRTSLDKGYKNMAAVVGGINNSNAIGGKDDGGENDGSTKFRTLWHLTHVVQICMNYDDDLFQIFFPDLAAMPSSSKEEQAARGKVVEAADAEYAKFCNVLLDVMPWQGIVSCDVEVLNCFQNDSNPELRPIDEDDDVDELREARADILTLVQTILVPCPKLLEVLDAKMEIALHDGQLSLVDLNTVLDAFPDKLNYPRLSSMFLVALSNASEEEKDKALYEAVLDDKVLVIASLRAAGFTVKQLDGTEKLFGPSKAKASNEDDVSDNISDDDGDDDDDDEEDDDDDYRGTGRDKRIPILYHAVKAKCAFDIISELVAMGADMNQAGSCPEQYNTHPTMYSPLGLAAHTRAREAAFALIDLGADLESVSYVYGKAHDYDNHVEYTPLMLAIEAQDLTIFDRLLEAGARAEVGELEQLTPLAITLHISGSNFGRFTSAKFPEHVVRRLLSFGADAVNGLEQMEYLELSDGLRGMVEREAKWMKNRAFVMCLNMSGFIGSQTRPPRSAAAATSITNSMPSASLARTPALGLVFGSIDLIRVIASFIAYPETAAFQRYKAA